MAIVNMYARSVSSGNHKISYACEKQLPGDPRSSEYCSEEPESVRRQFEAVREQFSSKVEKPMFELEHSFSPDESRKMSPEDVNHLGRELATTMFPGHQVLVVTHLDRDHVHNHIFVNRHHRETGKLARDNLDAVKKLRALNDKICLNRGLSIPNQDKEERKARVPSTVSKMLKEGRFSYIADTMQKADFSRSLATSYSEYQSLMGEFGIKVRIEKKNISYEYPGRKIAKRGKSMGTLYDKPGLERAFKENDEKFQKNPKLKELLASSVCELKSGSASTRNVIDDLAVKSNGHLVSGVKNYSKHEIVPRRAAHWARGSEEHLAQLSVPVDEMRRAKRTSIPAYCRQNGIALLDNGQGVFLLKGRPHVEISEYEWRNKRNKTRGNLIDLVAAHKGTTFLEAIAEINGNKRLLLLEQDGGKVNRTYTSFYIPKPKRLADKDAVRHLGSLLRQNGARPEFSEALLRSGQAHISKNGLVRLFGQGDEHGALEFEQLPDGKWKQAKRGHISKPFFDQAGSGRKATVFVDPFSFMSAPRKDLFPLGKHADGNLVLMESDVCHVDKFLGGAGKHVDTLLVTSRNPKSSTAGELDFFNVLKARYKSFGIGVELTEGGRNIQPRGHGLER